MEKLVETKTDQNGYFSETKVLDPWPWWEGDKDVVLWATLFEQADVVADGIL